MFQLSLVCFGTPACTACSVLIEVTEGSRAAGPKPDRGGEDFTMRPGETRTGAERAVNILSSGRIIVSGLLNLI